MFSIAKDCEVEVSSEDEGFKGAWYGAILQENPTKSGRKKLLIRYMTLVDEDGSSLLTELVEQRCIRPVPPKDLNGEVDFEEGSVVDADLKDGWWTGVVIKKLEDDKYLVSFDYPPDLIQFEKKQLRTHLDWIGSKWVRPENKELCKSSFSPGTMVEASCKIDKLEAYWVTALIVKEIEEDGDQKFIVKVCNSLSCTGDEVKPNITVDKCNVRPIPPPFFVEDYKLLDHVDAFRGSGWRQGLVRGILSGKRYSVSFLATKEESVFRHSDLRPSKEWENGIWHQGPKKEIGNKNPSEGSKRKKSVALETTLSEITALCRLKRLKRIHSCTKQTNHSPNAMELPVAREFGNQMADNGDANTPQLLPIEKEPPLPVVNATPVRETEALTTTDNIYDQPLSTWIIGQKSSDKSKLSPCKNSVTTMVLPFVKESPVWETFESMEVLKTVKKSPHFTPLLQIREEFREGSAVGEMVKYSGLLQRLKNLQLHTPKSTLEGLKECFDELDKYGFDVITPISTIDKLIFLKDKQMNTTEELKDTERKLTEKIRKKEKVEEDVKEVEQKIMELQRKKAEMEEKKMGFEKEMDEIRLYATQLDKNIQDVELEFQMILSAP